MRTKRAFITTALLALAAAFPAVAHAQEPVPLSQQQAFDDADQLPVPDRATDVSPFAPGSKPPYKAWYPQGELVDLHAHAFMEHGLGVMFHGDFDHPLKSNSWKDLFSSQINANTLDASGLGLVVVALYDHPILAPFRKDAIRAQVKAAQEFVKTHPNWVIAKNPQEAKAAYAAGKRIMVLSLEGVSGLIESEADLKEFVDQDGISIVTFSHLADDHLTGAALLPGYHIFGNPRGLISAWLDPHHDCYGALLNPNGLTEEGRKVAAALIKRHVWIDMTHSPESTLNELIPMALAAGQPLLFTHMGMRKYVNAEREISDARLAQVKASGGIVGLSPSESATGKTPTGDEQCKGGVYGTAAQYNELGEHIGDDHVYVGTDFNGAMDHLPPVKGCLTGTTLDQKGFYNISQTGEFWEAMETAGARSQASAGHGVDNFLSIWEKVWAPR